MNRLAKISFLGALCFTSPAWAVTQDFDAFISGRSAASTPLGSGDKIPVIQGGVTKQIAGNVFGTLADAQTFLNKIINGASNILTVLAGTQLTGQVPVGNGGTNLASGTSGGILCFTGSTTIASSAALTANSPVIGGGAAACPSIGSRTGNTTLFVTGSGSYTSGHGLAIDVNGNIVDSTNAVFVNVAQTFTAQQIFASVLGTQNNQSGTTYTFVNSDCGKPVYFTNAAAITATLPNSLPVPCTIEVDQGGAGQVTFVLGSGAAGGGASGALGPHGFTKTFGQGAVVGVKVITNSGGSSATWLLTGDAA